jgi:type I site-specific restriction endonuclease
MEQLSLPAFPYKIRETEGKTFILDQVRRKYVRLTPEEWVRQHVIHYLHRHLRYPFSLMSVERGTRYNSLQKRTDICLFSAQGNPFILIECKAPEIPITAATVQQAIIYNKTIQAPYLMVSNGISHFCWRVGEDLATLTALEQLPAYQG